MFPNNFCKLNKFSHCKFGKFCHFIHEDRKCQDPGCDAKSCNLRHPKPCRNIQQNKECKFGLLCSFEHNLDHITSQETSIETLREKIVDLENLLVIKDNEIKDMKIKLLKLENENIFNQEDSDLNTESSSSDDEDLMVEKEAELFSCNLCDFKTEHERGLNVHKSRKHKKQSKEPLERHNKLETFIQNICDKNSEEYGLVLKVNRLDEACLGIFSEVNPREDEFPELYLHCSDCWEEQQHSCQDFPENLDSEDRKDVIINHASYNPTLHAMLDWLVLGDITEKGCYLDWSRVNEMIQSNKCTNTA